MNSYSTPMLASIPPVMPNEFTGDQKKTGELGYIYESLACYYLACIGIKAEIRDGDGYDLFCESPDGSTFKAEVKARFGWIKKDWNPLYNFTGLKSKERSDVFIFINARTNHLVIKFKNEMKGFLIAGNCVIPGKDFSDYQTQKSLKKLADAAGAVDPKAPIMEADEEETARLTSDWLRKNADKIQTMQDAGLSRQDIATMFLVPVHTLDYIKRDHGQQSTSQPTSH